VPRAQTTSLLIRDVTLIDGTGRPAVPGAWVLVEGDRIAAVAATPIDAPAASVLDGRGKWLIPGLGDMHIHLARGRGGEQAGIRALHGMIYSGITSVFDAGNDPEYIFGLRARERAGEIVAPRIFASGGVVTASGGHGATRTSTIVDGWPEAVAALDAHIAREPDMVKMTFDEHGWGTRPLIPLLDPDLMARAGRYLNEHGIRTTVHISHEFRARQAIAAGINTLAHPIIQGPVSEEFVRLMASTKVPMVSTLTIGEGYSRLVEQPEFLDRPIYRDTYEPEAIDRMKTTTREQYAARAWTTWMKVMTPVAQENLRLIVEAGGVVVLGSDQSAGAQSHRELELMVAGGIPPLEAIRIGTLNTAIFLGRDRDLGSIEAGKLADLVLLNADPVADISNTQDIAAVIKGGRVVDRAALDLPVNRQGGQPSEGGQPSPCAAADLASIPSSLRAEPPARQPYEPLRGDAPELDLGIGHLRAGDEIGPAWLTTVTLPLFERPQTSPSAWLANGWVQPSTGPRRPLGLAGLVETGYEHPTFIVFEERPDGWVRLRVAAGAAGVVWTHACFFDRSPARLAVERWDTLFLSQEVSPLFFRTQGRHALRRQPADDAERLRWIPDAAREYAIHPLEVRDDWMRVELSVPSDYCAEPGNPAEKVEGWIRWRDDARGPWLWHYTRGC
jgi:imidazolonepropionase-like amidohydrolase